MAYPARQNDRIVKRTKIKESKNGKEYNYCYVEIGGHLWKISITEALKDANKDNDGIYWVGMKDCGRANSNRNNYGRGTRGGGNQGPLLPNGRYYN